MIYNFISLSVLNSFLCVILETLCGVSACVCGILGDICMHNMCICVCMGMGLCAYVQRPQDDRGPVLRVSALLPGTWS